MSDNNFAGDKKISKQSQAVGQKYSSNFYYFNGLKKYFVQAKTSQFI